MVSEYDHRLSRNSLHSLAASGGVLIGLFLIGAAYGHLSAVWPSIDRGMSSSGNSRLVLLLPGLILAIAGLINMGLCRALWLGMRWAVQLALVLNALAGMYFAYLLLGQVAPDHPIGHFVAMVSSYFILLAAIRLGLVWPAVADGLGAASSRD